MNISLVNREFYKKRLSKYKEDIERRSPFYFQQI